MSLVDGTLHVVSQTEEASARAESTEYRRQPGVMRAVRRRVGGRADSRFWLGLASAVGLGAAIRFSYLFHGAPTSVLGDGLIYHYEALRLVDGLGYTSAWGDVGEEIAHHPPGWITLLAGVTELAGRSMRAHQVAGAVIGIGVIIVAGLVGRRYAGRRVGILAAFLAALYPGFWVLDVQILSEPLALLLIGLLMLVLADLWERPTLGRAIVAGAVSGALALVRAEQLALFAVATAAVLLVNPRMTMYRRLAGAGLAAVTVVALIAPWTIHNVDRFEEPVVMSTNLGPTLLVGNCPPATYSGEMIGYLDTRCNVEFAIRNSHLDRSEHDIEARGVALDNMRDNFDRLPATVLARYGRTIGVFRPAQIVTLDATWLGSATWPVWAWITSFWVLIPLAAYGAVVLRRSKRFRWPLVAPLVVVLAVVGLTIGAPRYHAPADLGIVVLAAVSLDELVRRRTRAPCAQPSA